MGIDLVSSTYRRSPYVAYSELRHSSPVHWDEATASWYVGRFGDVDALLTDDRLRSQPSSSRASLNDHDTSAITESLRAWPLYDYSMQHSIVRKALLTTLGREPVRAIGRHVTAWTVELLSTISPEEADLVVDIARPLAQRCLRAMLGVSTDEADELLARSDRLFDYTVSGPTGGLATDARIALEFFDKFIREVVLPRRSGLVVKPLVELLDASQVTYDSVVGALTEIIFGSVEPTTTTIAVTLHELAHDSRARAALVDGTITPAAVTEEALRYDPSFHFAIRSATRGLEIGGSSIREGDQVTLVLASANHDDDRWHKPGRFDPTRPHKRHLAFGRGRHSCPGASLVRLQASTAVSACLEGEWLDAFQDHDLTRVPMSGATLLPRTRRRIARMGR